MTVRITLQQLLNENQEFVRISGLDNISVPVGAALFEVEYNGQSFNISLDQVLDYINEKVTTIFSDLDSANYYYYGLLEVDGTTWRINRRDKITRVETKANEANNVGITNLSAAWAARTTLNYG